MICTKCNFEIFSKFNSHFKSCDGKGPRRRREKTGPGRGWSKGKKWKDIVDEDKYLEMQKIWKDSSKPHTEETKQKLSKIMKDRYAAGWESKCGRAPKLDYLSPIAGQIKVDGSWELKVAIYLDGSNVKWQRNKKRFEYNNTIKGGISTYCPDFYVEDWDTFIEVKGYKTELDEIKWTQFIYKLEIWDKEKLKELKLL